MVVIGRLRGGIAAEVEARESILVVGESPKISWAILDTELAAFIGLPLTPAVPAKSLPKSLK